MMTYKADGPFVILTTTGKTTHAERQAVYDAIRADPNVPDGALLIIDLRQYAVRLTQQELHDRATMMIDSLGGKVGPSCAMLVGDVSLRIGLSFQLVAANMNFRVGVFHDESAAREWLSPGLEEPPAER